MILNCFSTVSHPSPFLIVYQALQFGAVFGIVGPVGDLSWARTGVSPATRRRIAVSPRIADGYFDEAIMNTALEKLQQTKYKQKERK